MNKAIVLCLLAYAMMSCGSLQPVSDPALLQLQKDVELAGKSKIDLYIRANEWFVKTFVNSESVIEFQSEEAGKILGKYVISYFEPAALGTVKVNQTISVQVKDGKARITIENPSTNAEAAIKNLRVKWEELAKDFEIFMQQQKDDF